MNSQIKFGALISYFALSINIIIGLIYTPWMINSIGKGDYGLYTLAYSVIGIFVFDFGLSQAVTRFIAKYLAEGRQDMVNKLLSVTYKMYIIADIIVFLLLLSVFFFIPQIYQGLTNDELEKFKVVYAVAACFSIMSFPFIPLNGILSASEKFIQLKLCDLANKLIIVVLMSGCLLMGLGLYALVSVNAIAGLLTIIIKLILIKRDTKVSINWSFWDKELLKAILGFSVWVTVIAVAQRFVLNLSPSILGMLADSKSIAVFGIAMTLEGYVYSFASAINGLFLPKVTRLVINDESQNLLPLMVKVGRVQIYIIGFIFIGFICMGENFINIWVGKDFSEVYLCAVLMISPSFISLTQEIGNTTVVVRNKVKSSAKISVVKALSNIIFAIPMTMMWGVKGMALSVCISYSISTLLFNILYHKGLNINIPFFFKQSFFKIVIPQIIVLIICYTLNIILGYNGVVNFFVKAFTFCIVYSFAMYAFTMNEEEKALFCAPLRKFKSSINKS